MRLHNFLDEITATWVERPAIVEDLFAHYDDVVQFDFGDITDVPGDEWKGLQDYGLELMKFRMFALPFERSCYSFQSDGYQYLVSCRIVGYEMQIIGTRSAKGYFTMSWGKMDLVRSAEKGQIVTNGVNVWPPQETESAQRQAGVLCVYDARNFIALTCMMQADGVTTNCVAEPTALNRARARKGKRPIHEIRTVHIKVGEKTFSPSGRSHGSHASPRLHWRRGHIRRLQSGQVTTVRPCLVGDVSAGRVAHAGYVVDRR